MNNSRLRSVLLILLLVLLIVMPYAAFLQQLIRLLFTHYGHVVTPKINTIMGGWKEVLLALSGLTFLGIWLRERHFPFMWTRLDTYLLIFTAFAVFWGGQHAPSVRQAILGVRYDFSPFFYYVAARAVWVDRDRFLSIVRRYIWLGLPIVLLGIFQGVFRPMLPIFGHVDRPTATFSTSLGLAMYLGLLLVAVWFLGKTLFGKTGSYFLMLLTGFCLLLIFSRGYLLSFVLAVVVTWAFILFWQPRRFLHDRPGAAAHFLTWGSLFLLVGSFWAVLAVGQPRQNAPTSLLLNQDSAVTHRHAALLAWESIKERPLGNGLGTSGPATAHGGGPLFNPQSWYLQITQELGWLGLLGVVGMLALLCRVLVQLYQDLSDQTDRRSVLFFLCGFLVMVFTVNFFSSWFETATLSWWILFGFFFSDYLRSFPRSPLVLRSQTKA